MESKARRLITLVNREIDVLVRSYCCYHIQLFIYLFHYFLLFPRVLSINDTCWLVVGNELERALRKIGREDVIRKCMYNIEEVTDEVERAVAKVHIDQAGKCRNAGFRSQVCCVFLLVYCLQTLELAFGTWLTFLLTFCNSS